MEIPGLAPSLWKVSAGIGQGTAERTLELEEGDSVLLVYTMPHEELAEPGQR